jgi:hypothetical protein
MDQWIGCDHVIAQLDACLQARRSVVVHGPPGSGKSGLCRAWLQEREVAYTVSAPDSCKDLEDMVNAMSTQRTLDRYFAVSPIVVFMDDADVLASGDKRRWAKLLAQLVATLACSRGMLLCTCTAIPSGAAWACMEALSLHYPSVRETAQLVVAKTGATADKALQLATACGGCVREALLHAGCGADGSVQEIALEKTLGTESFQAEAVADMLMAARAPTALLVGVMRADPGAVSRAAYDALLLRLKDVDDDAVHTYKHVNDTFCDCLLPAEAGVTTNHAWTLAKLLVVTAHAPHSFCKTPRKLACKLRSCKTSAPRAPSTPVDSCAAAIEGILQQVAGAGLADSRLRQRLADAGTPSNIAALAVSYKRDFTPGRL